ncbi:MAG: aromatic aminobenezylarsenical efflux permease ArsG family transporter [Nanoarchaeota archaeon]
MGLMAFMEAMGTSGVPLVAAFFIGLMTSISPCPLATNITAIAYVSRKVGNSKHTLLVGSMYALGRVFTYVLLAMAIVWLGLQSGTVSWLLQSMGDKLLGPLLIIIGVLMSGLIPLGGVFSGGGRLKEWLSGKGLLGSFLLGAVFALAFCPFSAVLFFGMLIPLAIRTGDAIIIPSVFALATGLPVIVFSLLLAKGVGAAAKFMKRVTVFEVWVRRAVAAVFIIIGLYYLIR